MLCQERNLVFMKQATSTLCAQLPWVKQRGGYGPDGSSYEIGSQCNIKESDDAVLLLYTVMK